MNFYSFSVLCFSFGVFLIAILAIIRRRDKVSIRFAVFSISVIGWGGMTSIWFLQDYSYATLLFFSRFSHVFGVFIPITWVHFVFEFIKKKEPFPHFYKFYYILSGILSSLAMTPFLVDKMHPILSFQYYTHPGIAFHLFTLNFVTLVPYGFYHLYRASMNAKGQVQLQLKYLIWGTVIGFSCGGTAFLPAYGISFPLTLLSLMPIYSILTGIALIRYGLFDVEEVLSLFRRDKLAAIGVLAASINHEIRNPLYVIQGLAESHLTNVEEGVYPDKEAAFKKSNEILEKTAAQATRAMEIMRRFSLFAKQNTDTQPDVQQIYLSQVLEDILPLVRHELELDKIEFHNQIAGNLTIQADPRHVEEILFNLIVNACQAMKTTGGKIELSAAQVNGHVNLLVKDSGPGIPQERLNRIFDPFYTTKQEGTGLGLYVTKQLIERNGGKISVKSQLQKGTIFELQFPAITAIR